MRSRVAVGIICTLLLLSVLKPVVPVWAGAILIAFVTLRAGRDLRSPYARERWSTFKRIAVMAAFGTILVAMGLSLDSSSLPSQVDSPAAARHIMSVLALYSSAMLGVPMLIHAHLVRSRMVVKRRIRVSSSARTLSRIAAEGGRRMTRVAV